MREVVEENERIVPPATEEKPANSGFMEAAGIEPAFPPHSD
jgi:hypothetical protein